MHLNQKRPLTHTYTQKKEKLVETITGSIRHFQLPKKKGWDNEKKKRRETDRQAVLTNERAQKRKRRKKIKRRIM